MKTRERNSYDFVLVTEVKNREFETNCLLSYELMRRGYSVKILQAWEQAYHRSKPTQTKVVVSWSMYNNQTFRNVSRLVTKCNKMINMQCEQLLSNGQKMNDFDEQFSGVHGKAREVAHLAWGEKTKERLVKQYGVEPDKVRLTGDISLDFCREPLKDYYLSKDEICAKYRIPNYKKIYLFISSFAMIDYPEEACEAQNLSESECGFIKKTADSQKEIIKWFKKILPDFQDGVIVYRPHPAERDSWVLNEVEKEFNNFLVIGEESIRQWISVSSKIYTWISTSIKEVYAAKKTCEVLRPILVDYENEMEIFENAKFTKSYKEFENSFNKECDFPILYEEMSKYIYIDEEPTYIKIADFFEEVLNNETYAVDFEEPSEIIKNINRHMFNIKVFLNRSIFSVNSVLGKCLSRFSVKWKNRCDSCAYEAEMRRKNFFSNDEYENAINKIKGILEN